MTKEAFHKTWYFRLLQVLFWSSYMAITLFLIVGGLLWSDVEIAGFVWAMVVGLVYWLIKKIFYYVFFTEPVFTKK